jgi:hypothetical protein
MKSNVTEEEYDLLKKVGFHDYGIDVGGLSKEFFSDLIHLCRRHSQIIDLQEKIESWENDDHLGEDQ